jgi:hypothetical protein
MDTILDVDWRLLGKPGIHLMYERRRLQGVTRSLALQMSSGDMAQFGINERQQPIQGGFVAAGVLMHEQRYGGTGRHQVGPFARKVSLA